MPSMNESLATKAKKSKESGKLVKPATKPASGQARVVIENVTPQVDGGRFPAKRVVGDVVTVEADVFGDGHDHVRARVLYRKAGQSRWTAVEMSALGNDHWRAEFPVDSMGYWEFTVVGEEDHFETWRSDLEKRIAAEQELDLPLQNGAMLIENVARRVKGKDAKKLASWAEALEEELSTDVALDEELLETISKYPDERLQTKYEQVLRIWVDRERAGYSSWYELFPRSWALEAGKHGTFRDVAAQLDYVREMGFNVLYFPPIHPIGVSFRKGKNNTTEALPGDEGSPWAIGAAEGGHTAIHPALGTFEDFEYLLGRIKEAGMELAMDIAFQCAPDHPWVKEHPEWFKKRADGSIQYAENPPKKYQDIYPIDFESSDWEALWEGLKNVFNYWAAKCGFSAWIIRIPRRFLSGSGALRRCGRSIRMRFSWRRRLRGHG